MDIFAELFVAYAGFAGVVVALVGPRELMERGVARFRVFSLLGFATAGVVLSLLPSVLSNIDSQIDAWRVCCAALGLEIVVWIPFVFRRVATFGRQGLSMPFFVVTFGIGIPIIAALLGSAFGWVDAAQGAFQAGLLLQLAVCGGVFVLLIHGILKFDPPTDSTDSTGNG